MFEVDVSATLMQDSFQPPVVSYPFGKKEARVIITTSIQHVQVVHMDYNNDDKNGISRLREGCGLWGVCVCGGAPAQWVDAELHQDGVLAVVGEHSCPIMSHPLWGVQAKG